jgi:hypothetical protein
MMRTVTISDELFDELKGFVVDPFDDTPDIVLGRLVEIVKKAKNRWSPLDSSEGSPSTGEKPAAASPKKGANSPSKLDELPQVAEEEVVLL